MDHENLLEKIRDCLRSEYQSIIDTINGRDTPISFDELYEKLINNEITLQQQHSLSFTVPTTANPIAPYPHKNQPPPSLALEAIDHHHDPFLVIVSGVVFKGTQLCIALSFGNLIRMSNYHQLIKLHHNGNHASLSNHRLMQQFIP